MTSAHCIQNYHTTNFLMYFFNLQTYFYKDVTKISLFKVNAIGKAFWGKDIKGSIRFTCALLKAAVKKLIEICFFFVENITLKQEIGIPTEIN